MRKTCTDRAYNMKKRLSEDERVLQERMNMFYSNKSDILEEIAKEKSHIRETKHLSTDADSSTDAI